MTRAECKAVRQSQAGFLLLGSLLGAGFGMLLAGHILLPAIQAARADSEIVVAYDSDPGCSRCFTDGCLEETEKQRNAGR